MGSHLLSRRSDGAEALAERAPSSGCERFGGYPSSGKAGMSDACGTCSYSPCDSGDEVEMEYPCDPVARTSDVKPSLRDWWRECGGVSPAEGRALAGPPLSSPHLSAGLEDSLSRRERAGDLNEACGVIK